MADEALAITMKRIDDVLVASISYRGRYEECAEYFQTLYEQIGERICGPPFCLYTDQVSEEGVHVECCVPVEEGVETEEIKSRTLGGGDVLCVTHCGPYRTLGESWGALFDHIEANNIRVKGARREIYLDDEEVDSEKHVTELQVPVAPNTKRRRRKMSLEMGITHKKVQDMLVAGIHHQGDLTGADSILERLERECREHVCGPALIVYRYGTGVKDGFDVDICFPVTQAIETDEVTSWVLEGGEALCLTHLGPHGDLRESYRKLYGYLREHGLAADLTGREIYMELNPESPEENVTELQAFLHPWNALFCDHLGRVLGEEAREAVMQGSDELTTESSLGERVQWVVAAIERLDQLADERQKFEVLSPCAHVFPEERIRRLRALYEQSQDIDRVLHVMTEDPDWYESPRREGNVIYVTKVPFDRKGFEEAATEAEKRMCYCHCPMARQNLDVVPPTFCYCGSGWYRQLWEGVLGIPVRVEILELLTKGDDRCSFAIHVPLEEGSIAAH